jgi:hypothetical protein
MNPAHLPDSPLIIYQQVSAASYPFAYCPSGYSIVTEAAAVRVERLTGVA